MGPQRDLKTQALLQLAGPSRPSWRRRNVPQEKAPMSCRNLHHESASCRFCEEVPPDAYRRHWKHERKAGAWHVIADGPCLTARLPRRAHFATILSYRPALNGVPVYYRGALYWEFDAEDQAQALADIRCCVGLLHTQYDCPLEALDRKSTR